MLRRQNDRRRAVQVVTIKVSVCSDEDRLWTPRPKQTEPSVRKAAVALPAAAGRTLQLIYSCASDEGPIYTEPSLSLQQLVHY